MSKKRKLVVEELGVLKEEIKGLKERVMVLETDLKVLFERVRMTAKTMAPSGTQPIGGPSNSPEA